MLIGIPFVLLVLLYAIAIKSLSDSFCLLGLCERYEDRERNSKNRYLRIRRTPEMANRERPRGVRESDAPGDYQTRLKSSL